MLKLSSNYPTSVEELHYHQIIQPVQILPSLWTVSPSIHPTDQATIHQLNNLPKTLVNIFSLLINQLNICHCNLDM
jgi:hypothetical protein